MVLSTAYTMEWFSCGTTECVHCWTSLMNMMVQFVESASTVSSHFLCQEEMIIRSRFVLKDTHFSVVCVIYSEVWEKSVKYMLTHSFGPCSNVCSFNYKLMSCINPSPVLPLHITTPALNLRKLESFHYILQN